MAGTLCAALATAAGAQEIPVTLDTGSVAETSAWAARVERGKQRYRRLLRDLPGSPSDAVMRLFLDGKSLRKVEVTYAGRARRVTKHYYIEDDHLRLAILRESVFENTSSDRVVERRSEFLWFAGDSLVYWLNPDGRSLPGETSEAATRGSEVLEVFRTTMSHRAAQYR
jgi:hypothetical protein